MKKILFGMTLVCCTAPTALAQTTPENAWKTFRQGCMHCHQPPAMSLPGGRAFVDQLLRTA